MVSQKAQFKITTQIDAGTGVGAVANDVAQTENLVDTLLLDVVKNSTQCFRIAMDIADNRVPTQCKLTGWGSRSIDRV